MHVFLPMSLQTLERRSGKLCKKYPENGTKIQSKQKQAQDDWEKLEDLANVRKLKLEAAYKLHRFLYESREHVSCILFHSLKDRAAYN